MADILEEIVGDINDEYDEDDDNYLSMRTEPLTRCRCEYDLNDDWRFSTTPEPFQHEPLSWLLHSLTEQDYGPEGPRVHLNDCLRIGQVHVDIKVWHQYIFDIKETGLLSITCLNMIRSFSTDFSFSLSFSSLLGFNK